MDIKVQAQYIHDFLQALNAASSPLSIAKAIEGKPLWSEKNKEKFILLQNQLESLGLVEVKNDGNASSIDEQREYILSSKGRSLIEQHKSSYELLRNHEKSKKELSQDSEEIIVNEHGDKNQDINSKTRYPSIPENKSTNWSKVGALAALIIVTFTALTFFNINPFKDTNDKIKIDDVPPNKEKQHETKVKIPAIELNLDYPFSKEIKKAIINSGDYVFSKDASNIVNVGVYGDKIQPNPTKSIYYFTGGQLYISVNSRKCDLTYYVPKMKPAYQNNLNIEIEKSIQSIIDSNMEAISKSIIQCIEISL